MYIKYKPCSCIFPVCYLSAHIYDQILHGYLNRYLHTSKESFVYPCSLEMKCIIFYFYPQFIRSFVMKLLNLFIVQHFSQVGIKYSSEVSWSELKGSYWITWHFNLIFTSDKTSWPSYVKSVHHFQYFPITQCYTHYRLFTTANNWHVSRGPIKWNMLCKLWIVFFSCFWNEYHANVLIGTWALAEVTVCESVVLFFLFQSHYVSVSLCLSLTHTFSAVVYKWQREWDDVTTAWLQLWHMVCLG